MSTNPTTPNDKTRPAPVVTGSVSLRKKKKSRTADYVAPDTVQSNSVQYFLLENTDYGDKASAVLLIMNGDYLEYQMTLPFFRRGKNPVYQAYIDGIECFTNVINPLDPATGKVWQRPNPNYDPNKVTYCGTGKNRKPHPEFWEAKAIAIPMDAGMTDEQIKEWHEKTFVPHLMTLGEDVIKSTTAINLHPKPVVRIQHWATMLSEHSIKRIVNREFLGDHSDLQGFLMANKANVCGIWKPGQVPLTIMKNHKLLENHLHKDDWNRLKNDPDATKMVQTTLDGHFNAQGNAGQSDN